MQVTRTFLFFLVLCAVVVSPPPLAGEPLSLEDCLSLAKKANLSLMQSGIAVEKARADVRKAYSSYYPTVDLSTGYRYEEGQIGEGSYSTGIQAQLTLYRGGSIRAGTRTANAGLRREEENYRLAEDEITLAVKEAFYTILHKQSQTELIDEILRRREEDLAIIKLKYDIGRESSPAVKEAEVNLSQARYDKTRVDKEFYLAKSDLNLILGRSREEEVSIRYEEEDVLFPPVKKMIEQAKAERSDMLAEIARREALNGQVAQARSGYLPTLSLSSSYGLRGTELLDQRGDWSLGASLSMPVFNGFATSADIKKATLSVKEEDLIIRELAQEIENEIEKARADWELAGENLRISEKALEAASEMYELTKLQYEQGSTSYLFLQQKESALTQAEYSHINAQYELRRARATLVKAWGGRDR